MTTATQATKTKANAKATARDASATARSAKNTATSAARTSTATPSREARRTEQGLGRHSRRVAGAAQAEVAAVAQQPTRPAYFALGLLDRTVATAKELPSTVTGTLTGAPAALRTRVVSAAATVGDLAERAQTGYTEVAKDGESLVRAIARQDSTQRAQRLAERARRRGQFAVRDTEKAVEAGTEAATQALGKLR